MWDNCADGARPNGESCRPLLSEERASRDLEGVFEARLGQPPAFHPVRDLASERPAASFVDPGTYRVVKHIVRIVPVTAPEAPRLGAVDLVSALSVQPIKPRSKHRRDDSWRDHPLEGFQDLHGTSSASILEQFHGPFGKLVPKPSVHNGSGGG